MITDNLNISTHYMGLRLESPVVVSACPLSEELSNIVRMEDAGAGAVVLFSLFEEQIKKENAQYDAVIASTSNFSAEALDFFPDVDDYHVGTTQYLELIRKAKEKVSIPIIGSLNGISPEGWTDYARLMEQAGADAIEINVFYIPADIHLTAEMVEQRYLNIIRLVRESVQIPIAVKMNPYFSAMGNMASRMQEAGADGLVLFNRFYQPDFDINRLQVLANLDYSVPGEIRLPLLWIANLYGKVPASLAATTGIQGASEAIKYLLAGADVTMTASALYQYGIDYIRTINADIRHWMEQMQFANLQAFKGVMSQQNVSDPSAYERANYIKILEAGKVAWRSDHR